MEESVYPAQRPLARRTVHVVGWLEEGGAQCGGERERNHHGKGHRGDDGDRELPVDHADRPREKRHRNKHRREREANAHQCRCDFGHGFAGGFLGGQAVFVHHPLHVLHHHDRVVHQQPDRQHHGEHGQHIDGVTHHRQHAEGAQQHHRDSNSRNQRGAQVLQKHEHHNHHQQQRLEQRDGHLLDGRAHVGRAVRADDTRDAIRKERCEFGHLGVDGVGHPHGIGAVGQHNAQTSTWPVIEAGLHIQVVGCQLHTGHIPHGDERTIADSLEHDALKLLRCAQLGARRDGGIEHLVLDRWQRPKLPGRDLRILRVQRRDNVGRHQRELRHLGRVHPDAHGVIGAKHTDISHAVDARNHVHHVAADVVTNSHLGDRIVR